MSSSIASLVEKATSENLVGEDWALIMNICDILDKEPNAPKTCTFTLQQRILHSNTKITNLALTLVDAILKNCNQNVIQSLAEPILLDSLRTKLNSADTSVYLKPHLNELLQTISKHVPTPTPDHILSQKAKVHELLTLLHSIPPNTSPTDHPTIQLLYQELIALRPNLIQLLTQYTKLKSQLIQVNDQLQHARAKYDVLMDQAIRTPSSYELYHPVPPPPLLPPAPSTSIGATYFLQPPPPPPAPSSTYTGRGG